jgi:hypothetical protein
MQFLILQPGCGHAIPVKIHLFSLKLINFRKNGIKTCTIAGISGQLAVWAGKACIFAGLLPERL